MLLNALDLDRMLDDVVLEAALSTGRDPRLAARQFGAAQVAGAAVVSRVAAHGRSNMWTAADNAFLRRWAGVLGDEEIARQLGRTPAAVQVHSKRHGLPCATNHPDYLTGHKMARALGVDVHAICELIDRGRLAAELAPLADRKVWRMRRTAFYAWALRPENWVYFYRSVRQPERIRDEKLRRLIVMRAAAWLGADGRPEEWWTTAEVAAYHGVMSGDVARYIAAWKLPAVRWANWMVRRSEATRPGLRFYKGKGEAQFAFFGTPAGDAFLTLAVAVGIPWVQIARLMGRVTAGGQQTRWASMLRRGHVPWMILTFDLPVQYRAADGATWADWRPLGYRFPVLARAWERLGQGERLTGQERMLLKGVAAAFMRWHRPDAALTGRLGRTGPARTADLVAVMGLYEDWEREVTQIR